jgi:hypothetical protein
LKKSGDAFSHNSAPLRKSAAPPDEVSTLSL